MKETFTDSISLHLWQLLAEYSHKLARQNVH